jgi:protein gp37
MAALIENEMLKRLENVWVGTSVENSEVIDRIDHLSAISGMTLFVSFEPLIGRISDVDLTKVHWAIVGGESGPRARPVEEEWVDRLHEICRRDDVAFFFKQWGGRNKKTAGRELHGQTYDEYPIEMDV